MRPSTSEIAQDAPCITTLKPSKAKTEREQRHDHAHPNGIHHRQVQTVIRRQVLGLKLEESLGPQRRPPETPIVQGDRQPVNQGDMNQVVKQGNAAEDDQWPTEPARENGSFWKRPLNGVQKVAGSNPVAPTSQDPPGFRVLVGLLFLPGDRFAGNSAGNPALFGQFPAIRRRSPSSRGAAPRFKPSDLDGPSCSRSSRTSTCTTPEKSCN